MRKLFIVHGWTYTLDAWDACLDALRARGIEPVMLRVPGLTEPSDNVWTLDGYVEWLRGKIAGEKDVALAGHSNGGRIALAYAAKYPGHITKLILIDTAGIYHKELPLAVKRVLFGTVAKVGRPFARVPLLRKIFHKLIGARDYGRAPENMRETMKNMISVDLTPILPSITAHTLIIWGQNDTTTPLSDGKLMNEKIVGSKLVIIPNTDHAPHATHAAVVAKEMSNWI